jgi:hypothetical protein
MKNIVLPFLLLILVGGNVKAQTELGELVAKTTDNFSLKIPKSFREVEASWENAPIYFFEGSNTILPSTHNNQPVVVTVFLVKIEGNSLEECKKNTLDGYTTSPDRVFPAGFTHGVQKYKLSSGQQAYITNTRFYRKSKSLYQSRYDLVVYSAKAKTGYLYTFSVQYADKEYLFEGQYKLPELAKKLYSNFSLK